MQAQCATALCKLATIQASVLLSLRVSGCVPQLGQLKPGHAAQAQASEYGSHRLHFPVCSHLLTEASLSLNKLHTAQAWAERGGAHRL